MSTHTLAPWIATKDGDDVILIKTDIPRTVRDGHKEICAMPTGTDEDAANMALITAAPDLLAMLRRFEHSILSLDEIPPTFCALDMEQARKALAKADGTASTFYIVAWNRRVNGISTDFYNRCDSLKNAKAFYSRVIAFDNLVTASIAAEIEGTDT